MRGDHSDLAASHFGKIEITGLIDSESVKDSHSDPICGPSESPPGLIAPVGAESLNLAVSVVEDVDRSIMPHAEVSRLVEGALTISLPAEAR